jgi:AbrB family looped-hinge helix DNA binding protein
MKATGIVRRIDDLGRVVIPKEIRRTMRIREGDPLEIYTSREGEVIFKKYSLLGGVEEFASQIDLAATLLGQMQIDHSDYDYSKDIFHPALPKFAYYTYNEGFGILEKEGMSLWDGGSKQASEGSTERQLQMGRTLLQQTYMDIANR